MSECIASWHRRYLTTSGCHTHTHTHGRKKRKSCSEVDCTVGTRSVSTLTPSQLARKRANDREAQRAIRARTKEHIERLERELEELKSRQYRDETVQNLLKRNKALERELMTLRESLGIQGRPYPPPKGMRHLGDMCEPPLHVLTIPETGYEVDSLPTPASAVSSRASSFGQGSPADYGAAPAFGSSYLPTPEPCESWPTVVPVSSVSVSSVVSSPCSSASHPDDYVPGYIPTSVPTSVIDSSVMPPQPISCLDGSKVEYEDLDNSKASTSETEIGFADWMPPSTDRGYCPTSVPPSSSTSYMQHQTWGPMYPIGPYYPQSPAL